MNKKLNKNTNVMTFNIDLDTKNFYGVINYYFEIFHENNTLYYGNNEEELGGLGNLYNENPKMYQITVYKERIVPKWYKEGIIYQIFVDRFFNGNHNGSLNSSKNNTFIYGSWLDDPMYIKDEEGKIKRWDFYGGNLKGVIEKLPYIKELGVNIIYMNPIFEAESCHKYDVGDYEKIDSMFGSNDDFIELCKVADKFGIKIILDGVFSHTGANSKYFNKLGTYDEIGAYQSKDSKYYKWYRFSEYPDKYESWWGFENQPNVEELEESYVKYIINGEDSIISKWMKLGAYGWRLDVADELPDEFIRLIKAKMLEVNSDSVLIGEVWEDASKKISYSERRKYFFGEELDSVTNYPLKDSIVGFITNAIGKNDFIKRIMSLYENYPHENFYSSMNLLGNHDTERILTLLNNDVKLLKLALAIQMTLPGVPLIYYGDEAGLCGGRDPENRKPYPWENINKDILELYKKFICIRNNEDILKSGSFKFIDTFEEVLIYQRELSQSKATIIVNAIGEERTIRLKSNHNIHDLISGENLKRDKDNYVNIYLSGRDFKILKEVL